MNDDKWSRIQDLFHQAIALAPDELDDFYQSQSHLPSDIISEVQKLVDQDLHQQQSSRTIGDGVSVYSQQTLLPEVDGYEIISLIAHGGMGSVYLANDTRLSRQVAIKLLHPHLSSQPRFKQRFMREARAAARLQHKNISTIYEIDESSNGQIHIASAYCPGKNLSERIYQHDLTLAQIISIMQQLLSALKEAHALGIVHRDLKPENIIIDDNDQIKLVDFGIAKIRDEHQTSTGEIIGTPAYMSPEQFRGEAIDPLTDIWALGMILYEMLEGRTPYEGKTAPEIMYQMLHQPMPFSASHQHRYQALYRIIQQCLTIDKAQRPATAEQLLQMLLHAEQQLEQGDAHTEKPEYPNAQQPAPARQSPSIATQRNILILYLFGQQAQISAAEQQTALTLVKKFRGNLLESTTDSINAVSACFGYPLIDDMTLRNGLLCALSWIEQSSGHKAYACYQQIEDSRHFNPQTQPTIETSAPDMAFFQQASNNSQLWVNQSLIDYLPESLIQQQPPSKQEQQRGFYPVTRQQNISDHPFTLRLSPFTGREAQLSVLQENWQHALEGEYQRVLISGEAGIGKSRLIYEFKHQLQQQEPLHLIELFCSPYEQSSTYYPILNYLRQQLHLEQPDQQQVENFIHQRITPEALDTLLLSQLLGVKLNPEQLAQLPAGDLLSRKYQSLLSRLISAPVAGKSNLLIIEDLHWVDQATSLIIEGLLQSSSLHATLIILSCRPEYKPAWLSNVVTSNLYLSKLRQTQSEQLLMQLIRNNKNTSDTENELNQQLLSQMAERTGGNPLFIEEMAKAATTIATPEDIVPVSIQDTLTARLDKLGAARELAQIASVIGRHFNLSLLEYCANSSEMDFTHQFQTLVKAEIFYQDHAPDQWYFKHALIRDAAYLTIQQTSRQALHATIAAAIETIDAQICSTQPSLLAQHWESSSNMQKAVEYWLRSAQRNLTLFAISESIDQCRHALKLTELLGPGAAEKQQLALYAILGPALMNRYGYADEQAGEAYSKALELSKEINHGVPDINILFGNWTYNCVRAEHTASFYLSQQMIKISESRASRMEICESYMVQGIGDFYRGNFLDARSTLQTAIEHYDRESSIEHIIGYGQNPFVATSNFQSWNELALGDLEKAKTHALQSIAHARETRHPMTLAYALSFATHVFMSIGDFDEAEKLVNESIQLCSENEVILFLGLSLILRALLYFNKNEIEQGEKAMAHASEVYLPTGAQVMIPNFLVVQAEVLMKAGRLDEAQVLTDQALSIVQTTRENWCLAPILAIKFMQLQACNESAQAQEYLQQLKETLHQQQALGIRMMLIQKGVPLAGA